MSDVEKVMHIKKNSKQSIRQLLKINLFKPLSVWACVCLHQPRNINNSGDCHIDSPEMTSYTSYLSGFFTSSQQLDLLLSFLHWMWNRPKTGLKECFVWLQMCFPFKTTQSHTQCHVHLLISLILCSLVVCFPSAVSHILCESSSSDCFGSAIFAPMKADMSGNITVCTEATSATSLLQVWDIRLYKTRCAAVSPHRKSS